MGVKYLKRKRNDQQAVSPVIAVLLMIAIAVAAAILVYVWSMGLIGTLTSGGGTQVREQVIMDAYNWNASTDDLVVYLRNVGSADVIVDAVYAGGQDVSTDMDFTLTVLGPVDVVTVNPVAAGGTYTEGVSYTVKIITKTGGVFSFACIYGGGY